MAPGKGPSMRWDEANKLQLLLQVLAQNPTLSFDSDKVVQSWIGDVKPTPRAVRNIFTDLRNQASKSIGGKVPSTPGARKSTASTVSNSANAKRKADTDNEKDEDNDDNQKQAKTNPKDTHIINPTLFKKRLVASGSRSKKRAKASSDDDKLELPSTSTTDAEHEQEATTSSLNRRGSARQSKTTAHNAQIEGGNDSDNANARHDDEDTDQDFDLDTYHRKEKGEVRGKTSKRSTWKDFEI